MKRFILSIVGMTLLCTSCQQGDKVAKTQIEQGGSTNANFHKPPVQRIGMVTGILEAKITAYKKLHAAVWPGVLKQIRASHIQQYTIYLQKIGSQYYLFSYFEYTGNNYKADMQKMAADSTTKAWWKLTAPMQIPLSKDQNETWTEMQEVFHMD